MTVFVLALGYRLPQLRVLWKPHVEPHHQFDANAVAAELLTTSLTISKVYCITLPVIMSYPTRPISSHMRAPSASASSSGQSPALLARIEEKKAELENLKELRELSAAVATQMEALEQKLSTLSDGTEGKQASLGFKSLD
jgi:hypothetical protein